jgi:hypothetical protein
MKPKRKNRGEPKWTIRGIVYGLDRYPLRCTIGDPWKSKDTGDPGFYYSPPFNPLTYQPEYTWTYIRDNDDPKDPWFRQPQQSR